MAYSGGDEGVRTPIMESVRQLTQLIESNAPREQIEQLEHQIIESAGRDNFQALQLMLPRFLQVARNLATSTMYENFRLPGRDRVVHDRRDEGKLGDKKDSSKDPHNIADKKTSAAMELRDGQLTEAKERTYRNYFGDRLINTPLTEQQRISEERSEALLSKFEKMILSRFEGGQKIVKDSPEGRAILAEKTEAQWKSFFQSFMERITARRTSLEEISKFLFRGLVIKSGKGIVISDMTLKNGHVEKFIRFGALSELLAQLAKLKPGERFSAEKLSGMDSDLLYLALAASKTSMLKTSPLPTAGKFMSGKAEGEAARELGIIPPASNAASGKNDQVHAKSGKRGLAGFLKDGREGGPEDIPYRFVPWWHWGNLTRPAPFRWTTTVFYAALVIITLIGIGVLTYRLFN